MSRATDIVRKVAPKARENYSLAFERGDSLLKSHGITTPPRLAHFLAQVLHETDGLTIEWESGSYSAPRLLQIFGVGNYSTGVTLKRGISSPISRCRGVRNSSSSGCTGLVTRRRRES